MSWLQKIAPECDGDDEDEGTGRPGFGLERALDGLRMRSKGGKLFAATLGQRPTPERVITAGVNRERHYLQREVGLNRHNPNAYYGMLTSANAGCLSIFPGMFALLILQPGAGGMRSTMTTTPANYVRSHFGGANIYDQYACPGVIIKGESNAPGKKGDNLVTFSPCGLSSGYNTGPITIEAGKRILLIPEPWLLRCGPQGELQPAIDYAGMPEQFQPAQTIPLDTDTFFTLQQHWELRVRRCLSSESARRFLKTAFRAGTAEKLCEALTSILREMADKDPELVDRQHPMRDYLPLFAVYYLLMLHKMDRLRPEFAMPQHPQMWLGLKILMLRTMRNVQTELENVESRKYRTFRESLPPLLCDSMALDEGGRPADPTKQMWSQKFGVRSDIVQNNLDITHLAALPDHCFIVSQALEKAEGCLLFYLKRQFSMCEQSYRDYLCRFFLGTSLTSAPSAQPFEISVGM